MSFRFFAHQSVQGTDSNDNNLGDGNPVMADPHNDEYNIHARFLFHRFFDRCEANPSQVDPVVDWYFSDNCDNKDYSTLVTGVRPSMGQVSAMTFIESKSSCDLGGSVFGYFAYDIDNPPESWEDITSSDEPLDIIIVVPNSHSTSTADGESGEYQFGLGNMDCNDGPCKSCMAPTKNNSTEEYDAANDTNAAGAYHASYVIIPPETYATCDGVYSMFGHISSNSTQEVRNSASDTNNYTDTDTDSKINAREIPVRSVTDTYDDTERVWPSNAPDKIGICPFLIVGGWNTNVNLPDIGDLVRLARGNYNTGEDTPRVITSLPQLNPDEKKHLLRTTYKPVVSYYTNNSVSLYGYAYVYGFEDEWLGDSDNNPWGNASCIKDYNDFVFYVRSTTDVPRYP